MPRVIDGGGRAAMDCVTLVTIASGDSKITGGGRVLANNCAGVVEIAWCTMGGECENGRGNSWSVGPGKSWPVSAEKEVRWGACHGANTIAGVPGSLGQQFLCRAPHVPGQYPSSAPLADVVTAARRGDSAAQQELGRRYVQESAALASNEAAFTQLLEGAMRGDGMSQAGLAQAYVTRKDLAQAYFWLGLTMQFLAKPEELQSVARVRELMAGGMTPSEITGANQRIRDWPKEASTKSLPTAQSDELQPRRTSALEPTSSDNTWPGGPDALEDPAPCFRKKTLADPYLVFETTCKVPFTVLVEYDVVAQNHPSIEPQTAMASKVPTEPDAVEYRFVGIAWKAHTNPRLRGMCKSGGLYVVPGGNNENWRDYRCKREQ